jgi:hypothetical protein
MEVPCQGGLRTRHIAATRPLLVVDLNHSVPQTDRQARELILDPVFYRILASHRSTGPSDASTESAS